MVWPTLAMAQEHYSDLSKKPFYTDLCVFFSSGPIVCMCWEGKDVIKQGRQMLGETQPLHSKPGSIRGDYSIDLGRNICHGTLHDASLANSENGKLAHEQLTICDSLPQVLTRKRLPKKNFSCGSLRE